MSKFVISGGSPLNGKIIASGSKNSALALIPATLVADGATTLTNLPDIRDVSVMLDIAESLGCKVTRGKGFVTIDPAGLKSYELSADLSSKVRASVIFAAPLLSRFGKAVITPPGGDQIGERLLDTHFSMLKEFGVAVTHKDGKFHFDWGEKKTPRVFLEEASVTATEMGLILAAKLLGNVTIDDAAAEPHVEDLISLLNAMGAKITGAGTNRIQIQGVTRLSGVEHKVISDYICSGTFAIAAAITGGKVEIQDCGPRQYDMMLNYLGNMGVDAVLKGTSLIVNPSKLAAAKRKFQTRPWPGFPTDLMSPFIVLATQTEGTVLCHDWMYEWRIFFVDDLISMGANIFIADPHRVVITGKTPLHGEKLFCKDIRAGMSVILAALVAKGESEIENIEMVERGYEKIEERFTSLGAKIARKN
jgi:UDP-N-acetylglucosamine 1-carboxyvinyltransferase